MCVVEACQGQVEACQCTPCALHPCSVLLVKTQQASPPPYLGQGTAPPPAGPAPGGGELSVVTTCTHGVHCTCGLPVHVWDTGEPLHTITRVETSTHELLSENYELLSKENLEFL